MPTSLSAGDVMRHVALCRSFRLHLCGRPFDCYHPRATDQTQSAAAVAARAQETVLRAIHSNDVANDDTRNTRRSSAPAALSQQRTGAAASSDAPCRFRFVSDRPRRQSRLLPATGTTCSSSHSQQTLTGAAAGSYAVLNWCSTANAHRGCHPRSVRRSMCNDDASPGARGTVETPRSRG